MKIIKIAFDNDSDFSEVCKLLLLIITYKLYLAAWMCNHYSSLGTVARRYFLFYTLLDISFVDSFPKFYAEI